MAARAAMVRRSGRMHRDRSTCAKLSLAVLRVKRSMAHTCQRVRACGSHPARELPAACSAKSTSVARHCHRHGASILKKLIVTLLKFGISIGILVYLLNQARRHQSFEQLRDQPKDWAQLGVAWLLAMAAVSISFVRWFALVRVLGLSFRMRDAFRLGFLGYLLNFVSVGSVGGDLFKAVFIAREQPRRRTEAVATVLVDRIIGMFSLFVLASAGILLTGAAAAGAPREIQFIARTTLGATVVGTCAVLVLLVPASTGERVHGWVSRMPKIGAVLASLVSAARVYRGKISVLAACCLMSLGTHVLFTLAVFNIARGLPGDHPPLAQHFVIVPMGMAAGGLPLPLGALGAFEYVLDFLYRTVSSSNQGLVVALGYRLITVVIAMVGAGFYLSSRREVAAVLHEAEIEQQNAAEAAPGSLPA